jgi:hypothetical protein
LKDHHRNTKRKTKQAKRHIRIQLQSMKRFFTASRYLAVTLLFIASVVVVQAQDDPDADDRLVDIGFVVDVTGSFSDDIAAFKLEAAAIVSDVTASFPNALFGLATFQDYPLKGWGSPTSVPHARVSDLVPGDAAFLAAVNSLSVSGGGDFSESQLESLYQCITGAGHVVPTSIGGGFTIPSGLNFNFRSGSARILILWTDATFHDPINTPDYPGPTMAQVIQAALTGGSGIVPRRRLQEDFGPEAVRVVGIVRGIVASDVFVAELRNTLSHPTAALSYCKIAHEILMNETKNRRRRMRPRYWPQLPKLRRPRGRWLDRVGWTAMVTARLMSRRVPPLFVPPPAV